MAVVLQNGINPRNVGNTMMACTIYTSTGYLAQADFVLATGSIGVLDLPVGTHIFHAGTIEHTGSTVGCCHIVRMLSTNNTIADWFLVGDTNTAAALTTLING